MLNLKGRVKCRVFFSCSSIGLMASVWVDQEPRRVWPDAMFPSAPPAPPATWDLDVQSLTTAVTLSVAVSMTVEELRKIIADRLGIAAQNQMWHVQGERLKLQDPQNPKLDDIWWIMTYIMTLHLGNGRVHQDWFVRDLPFHPPLWRLICHQ